MSLAITGDKFYFFCEREDVLIGAVPAVGGYKVLCAGYADVIGFGKPYLTVVSMLEISWVLFTDRSHSRGQTFDS